MKKFTDIFRIRFMSFFIYCMLGIIALALVIFSAFVDSSDYSHSDSYTDFSSGWKLERNSEMSLSEFSSILIFNSGDTFSFYKTLPNDYKDGSSLVFRSTNVKIALYIDDKLVYEFGQHVDPIYGRSPGNNWNVIDIPVSSEGEEIRMDITMCYADSSGKIDNISFGHEQSILADMFRNSLFSLIVGMILTVVGVVFILIDFSLSSILGHKHSMLFFGLFSVVSGVWVVIETRVLSVFEANTSILHLMAGIAMMFMPLPIIMYTKDALNLKHLWIVRTLTIASFVNIIVSVILHFTFIADVHETAIIARCLVIASCVILMSLAIEQLLTVRKKNKNCVVFVISSGIITLTSIADLLIYYFTQNAGVNVFSGVGLLIFVGCSAVVSFTEIIDLLRIGLKANLIGKLAFTDGLTNIGNTTAFRTDMDNLERDKEKYSTIGIVQFDVNDLKKLNDTKGHQAGDLLISSAAKLISDAFSPVGSCYRIGGDEFVSVITAEHAPQKFDIAVKVFENSIAAYNSNPDRTFDITIAYGVAFYDKGTGGILKEILRQADARMYKKKKQMKQDAADDAALNKQNKRI